MSADAHPDLAAYYHEAKSWDADRITALRSQARFAWRVAAVASLCTVAACAALLALLPLKRVEPYLIRVDSTTGVVDVVPAYAGTLTAPESVTRYLLTHYVLVCERFNYATAESDYEECGAFHTPQRNQAWYARWDRNNPASPLNVHRDGSTVSVQIQSVSFFKRATGVTDTAQVRYLKIERQASGAVVRTSHWIGTIRYAYSMPPGDPAVRRWNPLGFKILDLVSEPEVVHDDRPARTPTAAVTGGSP